ncbi:hypothetical protein HDR59_04735 [bacterium]|nr:hypothetical protein [bacterium]
MKVKILKVLVLAYLCVSSINCKSQTLQQILSAYCVPTNASVCTSNNRATFTGGDISSSAALTTNYCQCGIEDYYYDKSSRVCVLCEDGTYNRNNKATSCTKVPCPVGTVPVKVDSCPSGSVKTSNF